MKKYIQLTFLLTFFYFNLSAQGFLHRDNKNIVDGNGNNIILRGIGLGGWMLQEPYMLNLGEVAGTQHQIRAKIESTIGKANTDTFYQAWLNNYMQKIDVDSLKAYGFNSIRLPMHYNLFTLPIEQETVAGTNTWLDKGFILVDSLLKWCTANQIYLILDMHATPGGQGKDAAISDYDNGKYSLWESTANQNKLIALWKKLAERYVNEKYIGGYDLINEINWDFESSGNQNGCNCNQNTALWNLYSQIITAVRQVDKNHMIIIEGNCWGNNYNGLGNLSSFDTNMAISFHKYWNYNNTDAIQGMLNLRNSTNLPLWCGESGENSNVWFTQAISLLEANNIGWAWWTYKKFNSTTGINSVVVTPDYSNLVNYWKNGGTNPGTESAKATLLKMADNLKLKNCIFNSGVTDAMIRQVKTAETKPYKNVHVPGILFSANYDYGRIGAAYFDTDSADYHSVSSYTGWNSGSQYRNDGVDIEACSDAINSGFSVGWTITGEWMQYTVNVDSTFGYKITLRYASTGTTAIHFLANNLAITKVQTLPSTGGWTNWTDIVIDNVILTKGVNKIKLYFDQGGCNINYMKFDYSKKITEVPFDLTSAYTSEDGKKVYVEVNSVLQSSDIAANDFSVNVDNAGNALISASRFSDKIIELVLTDTIIYGQKILLSYSGSQVQDTAKKQLQSFTNFEVINKRTVATKIPARIQAENYFRQQGLVFENCSDDGGGKNSAYANQGDYLDYFIISDNPGKRRVNFRVSSKNGDGLIKLQLVQGNNTYDLGNFNVPATGDWQKFTTIGNYVNLPKGQLLIRVLIANTVEFNINWFEFTSDNSIETNSFDSNPLIYPNPASTKIRLSSDVSGILSIYSIQGQLLLSERTQPGKEIDIQKLRNGFYMTKLTFNNKEAYNSLIICR